MINDEVKKESKGVLYLVSFKIRDEEVDVLKVLKDITKTPPKIENIMNCDYITSFGKPEDSLLMLQDLEKTISVSELNKLKRSPDKLIIIFSMLCPENK